MKKFCLNTAKTTELKKEAAAAAKRQHERAEFISLLQVQARDLDTGAISGSVYLRLLAQLAVSSGASSPAADTSRSRSDLTSFLPCPPCEQGASPPRLPVDVSDPSRNDEPGGGDSVSVASVSLPSILANTVSPLDHSDRKSPPCLSHRVTESVAIFTDYTFNADVNDV